MKITLNKKYKVKGREDIEWVKPIVLFTKDWYRALCFYVNKKIDHVFVEKADLLPYDEEPRGLDNLKVGDVVENDRDTMEVISIIKIYKMDDKYDYTTEEMRKLGYHLVTEPASVKKARKLLEGTDYEVKRKETA